MPKPRRERGGRFRRYDADAVTRLRFIRRARQLGFTLDEVRGLLGLALADGENARAETRKLAAAHVADIRAKIADLEAMEHVLTEAICECETGQGTRCPLIEVLSEDRVYNARILKFLGISNPLFMARLNRGGQRYSRARFSKTAHIEFPSTDCSERCKLPT